jgi:hypothetical protein
VKNLSVDQIKKVYTGKIKPGKTGRSKLLSWSHVM